MNDRSDLNDLIELLNLVDVLAPPKEETCKKVMGFLREKKLVKFILYGYRRKHFSVFSRDEVQDYVNNIGDNIPFEMKMIHDDLNKSPHEDSYTFFPEDSSPYGSDFLREFNDILFNLDLFFDKLNSGFIDIVELNKHFYDMDSQYEFRQTNNPLKPTLEILRGDNCFCTLDVLIFDRYIYPKIFSGKSQELTKVKKCRNCGDYFLGKRLSAIFCSDKCRGAFHHANS